MVYFKYMYLMINAFFPDKFNHHLKIHNYSCENISKGMAFLY